MADKQLRVVIVGDAKSVQKAFADTGTAATQAEVKVEGFGKSFAKLGASVGTALAAFAAVKKVGSEIGSAVEEAGKGQQQLDQLGAVLKSTGGAAGVTAKQAVDLSTSLQTLTTYSDQAVLGAENLLLTFTAIGKDVFPQATQTVLDMSTAMGQDLKSSALQLGKALQDPITGISALHDVGVNFTAQQVEQVKAMVALGDVAGAQKLILAELNKEFGGSAQAEAKGYAGQVKQLTNQYNDLKEAIGNAALPALTDFTKALSNGAKSTEFQAFIATLTHDLQALFSGNFFDEWLVSGHKAIFLLSDALNNTLKEISGGKLNIDGLLGGMRKVIADEESKIKASIDQHVVKPVADGLSGAAPGSAIAPAKVQGYGKAALDNFLQGLSSSDVDGFTKFKDQFKDMFKDMFNSGDAKADAKAAENALADASGVLAQALSELWQDGQITDDTMLALSSTFKLQVPEVVKLLRAYAQMSYTQDHATDSTKALAAAQQNLTLVQNQAKNATADADKAITAAQKTATDNAAAATEAIDQEQAALSALGKEAEAVARADQAAIDGLQASAAAHAEENQRIIADAQAALSAATEQRKRDADIAQAAINGTTEAYERQTEGLTEQDRKLAEHYKTIIGGERRAKDAADERLNGLNKAANKEDLDFLTRIDEARKSGHAKEANALQRQYDARKKQRGTEIEIARAQAAVAGDEYDTKVDAINKEEKKRDEVDAKAETEAGKRVKEVQTQADAQAKADAAAIKGAQDAAKADADRYAAQQRGIQDEIDKLQDAQKAQERKDKKAIEDAQTLKTETENRWKVEESGATVALGLAKSIADANERTAKAAKDTYDADVARAPIARQAADDAEREAAARAKFSPGPTPLTGPESTGTPESTYVVPGGRKTPPPPRYMATKVRTPPPNYHFEVSRDGTLWFIADGFTLADYGDEPFQGDAPGATPTGPSGNGGSDSLSRGGQSALREAGTTAAGAGVGAIHLHINAPGLTDVGSPAQQRALAAQVGDAALRAWTDVQRGGPPQGVV